MNKGQRLLALSEAVGALDTAANEIRRAMSLLDALLMESNKGRPVSARLRRGLVGAIEPARQEVRNHHDALARRFVSEWGYPQTL